MKIKHIKLYRPITLNGVARESVSEQDMGELRFLHHLNMIQLRDRRGIPILVPLTNIEHLLPYDADLEELEKTHYTPVEEVEDAAKKRVRKVKEVN